MKKHIVIDKIKPDNYLVRGVGKRAIHIDPFADNSRSFAVAREVQMLKDSMATSKKCREDFKNSLSDEVTDAARKTSDGSGSGVVHASKHPLEHLLAPSDGNGTEITSKEGQRKLPHRALGECEVYEHGGWRVLEQHPFDQFLFTPEELSAKMSAYPNADFLVHPEIHNDSAVGELRVEPFIETPFVLEDEDSVQIVSVKNRDASIPQPDQPGEPE